MDVFLLKAKAAILNKDYVEANKMVQAYIQEYNAHLEEFGLCIVPVSLKVAGDEFLKLKERSGWTLETAEDYLQMYVRRQ